MTVFTWVFFGLMALAFAFVVFVVWSKARAYRQEQREDESANYAARVWGDDE